jgi:hypothetical protein
LTNDAAIQNWYAFFSRENGQLKLRAVRTLALTGMPYMALQELRRKALRSSEEEWQYRNLELWLSSDATLKEHAKSNRTSLDEIATLARRGRIQEANARGRSLFFTGVEALDDGSVKVVLGGVVDNAVGFINIPADVRVPSMSDDNYILVEPIEGGWYLYKTT